MAVKEQIFSFKRLQISKASTVMVTVVGIATFVTVFSLFVSKAFLDQRSYQAQVIAKKEAAKAQLVKNLEAKQSLEGTYRVFVSNPINVIGGTPGGQGERDGDNARLVLDSLPSKYDFPALTSSLEKILTQKALAILNIGGTDDEINQQATVDSQTPVAVDVPFGIEVRGSYAQMQDLVLTLERSIRPFHINTLSLRGSDGSMQMTLEAKTYYQPEKKLDIKSEVVQ